MISVLANFDAKKIMGMKEEEPTGQTKKVKAKPAPLPEEVFRNARTTPDESGK